MGANTAVAPTHPAYTAPTNVAHKMRAFVAGQFDPRTAVNVSSLERIVAKMYDAAGLEDPPLRLPLGEDTVELLGSQLKGLQENLEKWKGWSKGLKEQ